MSHSSNGNKTGFLSRRDLFSRVGRRGASRLLEVSADEKREKDAETFGTLRQHSRDEIGRLVEKLSAENAAGPKNQRKE